jgi:hypothetical protein
MSDGTLVEAMLHLGSRNDAFTEIYRRYGLTVISQCTRLLSENGDVEHATADTFVEALEWFAASKRLTPADATTVASALADLQ